MSATTAVFFDVDFTLIHPGPRFQAEGYTETCARHGVTLDHRRYRRALVGAAAVLDEAEGVFDPQVFINYTARIIELMGGDPALSHSPARELYEAWGSHEHFTLYDDVADTLRELKGQGIRIGLITNGHRSLTSFETHFALDGLIDAAVSSAVHGYMKPHESIFRAGLDAIGAEAAHAVMVGDSYPHDIAGARAAGMRAVLLDRTGTEQKKSPQETVVIRSLRELSGVL